MINNELKPKLIRVALYIRVSGEEQKIKGLSLESQRERLEAYAREQGWVIVGIYIDAAKTARKKLHKRSEFQRMLDAVRHDEVDMLLFTRLDRWFRSVPDYYKVMEVLEAHNCEWKTIDDGEGYDTTTASGRLYINIKLSIAQNEADLDGERIDVVFDSKVQHGTVLSGKCPFWLRVNEEKRLELVPEKLLSYRTLLIIMSRVHLSGPPSNIFVKPTASTGVMPRFAVCSTTNLLLACMIGTADTIQLSALLPSVQNNSSVSRNSQKGTPGATQLEKCTSLPVYSSVMSVGTIWLDINPVAFIIIVVTSIFREADVSTITQPVRIVWRPGYLNIFLMKLKSMRYPGTCRLPAGKRLLPVWNVLL